MFRAKEVLDTIDHLIAQSKVDPTDRVTATRDTIAEIVCRQTDTLDGLTKANDAHDSDIDILAVSVVTGQLTPTEVVTRLTDAGRRDERAFTKLRNKIGHTFDRDAEFELRKLGDTLIGDILTPWAERIVTDLTEVADVVVEHGPRTAPQPDRYQPTYDHADTLVADLHKAWLTAAELRGRGVLTDANDVDPRHLCFVNPHKLADLDKSHRKTWWTCYAIVNGAQPVIRSVDQVRTTTHAA